MAAGGERGEGRARSGVGTAEGSDPVGIPSGRAAKALRVKPDLLLIPPPSCPFVLAAFAKGCENGQKCAFLFGHGGAPGFFLSPQLAPAPPIIPLKCYFSPLTAEGFWPCIALSTCPPLPSSSPHTHPTPRWVFYA